MIEILFVLLTGLALGSFITCASYRLPLGIDVVRKPSYCPSCNTKLGFRDLWPVVSWGIARGKCRHCGVTVSMRYPLTEMVTAALFLCVYARYGFTIQTLLLCAMAVMLLIMIIADLEHYMIPDSVHVVLLPLGLGYHYMLGTEPFEVLNGFLLGAGLGLLLHYGYSKLRGRVMLGFGDVKFMAVAGVWLTLYPFVPFLFFAGLIGVIFGLAWRGLGKGAVFPFGPALAASLFVCVAYPEMVSYFWGIGEVINRFLL